MAIDLNILCEAVQQHVDEMFAEGENPELLQEDNGLLLAITSPENTGAVSVIPLSENGAITKKGKVIVTHRQRPDVVSDTIPACFPDNLEVPAPVLAQEYTLDDYVNVGFEMGLDEWREMCRGSNPYRQFALYMMQYTNAAVERMNQKEWAKVALNFGNYYGGVDSGASPIALSLLQGSPEAVNASGYYDMENAMADIGASRYMSVGTGKFRKALQLLEIGCCNDGGIDLSQIGANMFYQDRYTSTALSTDRFIAFQPGSIIIPNFGFNVGEYQLENSLHRKITMQHPRTGLIFDIDIKIDANCNKVLTWVRKTYTTIYTRTGLFGSNDPMEDVNGVLQFNAGT